MEYDSTRIPKNSNGYLQNEHPLSDGNSRSGNAFDVLKNVGISQQSSFMRQTDNESNKRNLTERILSFNDSGTVISALPYKSYDLARNGYYLGIQFLNILCAFCNFKILVDDVKRQPSSLLNRHKECSPRCESVLNNTLRLSRDIGEVVADSPARSANAANYLNDSAIGSVGMRSSTSERGLGNLSSAGLRIGATARMLPSQSESRLPVPVHVKSVDGRLSADAPMIRSSNGANSEAPARPSMRTNPPPPRDDNAASNAGLKEVRKPVPRDKDYDTYESRLRTYSNWPSSNPMRPEELARAGFLYTNHFDKTKCPYCLGSIFNWEPNDTAFGEHSRHYPHCEFLKYTIYEILSTPVPLYQATQPSGSREDSPSVIAVLGLGYPLEVVHEALTDMQSKQIRPCSDNILDTIYSMEAKKRACFLQFDFASDAESDVSTLEGAVGGMTLNEPTPLEHPPVDADEELYRPTDVDSGNFDLDLESIGSRTSQAPNVEPEAKAENPVRIPAFVDPEVVQIQEEYKRLHKSNICNQCGKNPVNILFLPCRHLVTCEECAEDLDECLECHAEIIGTVKVFLT